MRCQAADKVGEGVCEDDRRQREQEPVISPPRNPRGYRHRCKGNYRRKCEPSHSDASSAYGGHPGIKAPTHEQLVAKMHDARGWEQPPSEPPWAWTRHRSTLSFCSISHDFKSVIRLRRRVRQDVLVLAEVSFDSI